ncbi:related to galactose oxidase precursor [Colletotrichum higginsianum]|nr:related to galactose oxidase precursor [Colletotrichum higginsianum]
MYGSSSNGFMPGPNMRLGRGYQSSVTLSSGRIFTNGGSWSGQLGGKNGEIFDPATNAWTALPGALIQPSLTQDVEANKRDNHQWFFAWRNDSIFQAGPSKQMLWYWGSGTGRVQYQSIGIRDTEDAMRAWHGTST